ncbi:efflux RND transporter periplasmic adaptor subunit [Aliikangiella coralliicola]|uniref:Efflux RND transporter periplasmic adaptor subunit n=1 Tax=Aliikangiella coralliicola TaxID=2592383 RepID=A0A545UAV6_9GAMM|nr:efflux RND transporter periplasmic adaptor subunit [Aliikangiella coralliicola]TQV86595.1 efflux RND transporter periplasmic adaptor subunit [Aliikangiella coralliicola]
MKKALVFTLMAALVVGIPLTKKYFKSETLKEVEIEQVTMQTIKASILASGQLKHEEEVKLSAEVIGKVSKLYVEEGQKVSKGQLVLKIDDQTYVAAVEQQQAAVDQQRVAIERQKMVVENLARQWKRKTKLFEQKLLDTDAYDAITHQYSVAKIDLKAGYEQLKQVEARLEQSKDQLSKTKVVSPIDGTITSLDIKEGETAISGTTNIVGSSLMTIADPQSMLAEINVDEADIANINVGQKAEIIAIAFSDTPLSGTVESIASSAKVSRGSQSLSFAVKLKLGENADISLRPGMSCRAEVFTRGEQNMLAVPVKAIQTEEDNDKDLVENFVFVLSDGVAKKTQIKAGISDDSFQQILEGLDKGVSIITGPDKIVRHLKDGDKVAIADNEA